MALTGLINAYLMRLSLNITILKMVHVVQHDIHALHDVPEVHGKNNNTVFLNVFRHTVSSLR